MANKISYSFHISSKKHSVRNKADLARVMKHNTRVYESGKEKGFDKDKIFILKGSKNIIDDVKKKYDELFLSSVIEYNAKQKRSDRYIVNYFDKVSNEAKRELAVECIIQIGSKEDKFNELGSSKDWIKIYEDELEKLERNIPGFKVANAVLHLDEATPHMHVVGIPFSDDFKKGMHRQVAKAKVFTKESLEEIQNEMRKGVDEKLEHYFNMDFSLKEKEKGRNYDLSVSEYKKMKESLNKRLDKEFEEIREERLKEAIKPISDKEIKAYRKKELAKAAELSEDEIKEIKNYVSSRYEKAIESDFKEVFGDDIGSSEVADILEEAENGIKNIPNPWFHNRHNERMEHFNKLRFSSSKVKMMGKILQILMTIAEFMTSYNNEYY